MTTLEVKLASLVVHLIEERGPQGHSFDLIAARSLMEDPDVAAILTPGPLIPTTRSGRSVAQLLAGGAAE